MEITHPSHFCCSGGGAAALQILHVKQAATQKHPKFFLYIIQFQAFCVGFVIASRHTKLYTGFLFKGFPKKKQARGFHISTLLFQISFQESDCFFPWASPLGDV